MNTDTHPDIDELKAYLHNSESPDYAALRLHLAQCSACRDETDALSAIIYNPACLNDAPNDHESLSDEQHQLIIDYIDGSLQAHERVKAESLIDDNKYAMKSALHYTSHRSAMADLSGNARPKTSGLSQILDSISKWFDIRTPVWVAVPVTALTVAIVIYSLQPFTTVVDADSRFVVASFQDNPVLQFRSTEAQPGIGFFSKATNFSREYNGVLVKVLNNGDDTTRKIRLHWPIIKNAIEYSMRLQVFNQGQKINLGNISTMVETATFEVDQISHNKRYEWILTGKTSDKKTFYSTGGFVISKVL